MGILLLRTFNTNYSLYGTQTIFGINFRKSQKVKDQDILIKLFIYLMGSTLIKGGDGEENEPQTELNLILKSISKQVNHILQNQNKNLESIKQQLKEQTNYLKTIAENIIKPSNQLPQTKMGDMNYNTSQKSIQLGQQSSTVSLPSKQIIQSKECLQIKQSLQQEFKKSNKRKEMENQLPQLYLQKRTEIYNRIQKIEMTLKNQLNPRKNDPIFINNKNSNQLQKILALQLLLDNQQKNSVNIDYKDRFIVMPLVKYEKYSKLNMIDPWISDLYENLSEEAFYGYLHKYMSKEQTKVFFSQNLILNIVKMIRSITEKNKQISIRQILKKFSDLSDSTLEFQLKKYPQKKKIFIRPQIYNMIYPFQNNQDPQYDIMRNMKFHFQYEQNGIYYKQIKLMINKIINLINQHFQQFQKQMKKIFTLEQQKQIPEDIQHQIGRKINQNTPQFEQHQINTNKITIQSPQIMRIIIKWIQELEDKIQNLEKYIDNRQYPFPLQDGGQIKFSKQYCQQISEGFKQYLSKHDQYKLEKNIQMLQNIQNQIINYIDTNSKSFTYISQNNIEVGLATHLLSETVQQIAIKRLNQLIHCILRFQKQFQLDQIIKQISFINYINFSDVDYITFSVYDLLRSRCTGSYQKIKIVYDRLKQNTNFQIIRVKNRLTTGNRDFLINMRFKKTPIICELQLGLILERSNINQKQDRLGDFNHFLYELKRSRYGPLTQVVMLNAHYSQSITFFQQKLKKIKFQKERKMKIQSIKPKICNDEIQISGYEIQEQQIIFVCHNCLQVKYTKTSFLNTYKKMKKNRKEQFQYLCGECVVNSLQKFDRNKYLLGEYIEQYFQQTNQDQILKNSQEFDIGKVCYYLIISINRRRYIVKRLDNDYFIQTFSPLFTQQYQFLKINQLGIKYVYRLVKQVSGQNNIIKIHNIQELNQRAYINQQKRQFLTNNQKKWKQVVYIEGYKGCLLIDVTKQQNGGDYKSNLNIFIKKNQLYSNLQYINLRDSGLDQEFFQQNLRGIKQIKKLNLSENNLTDINQIIKGKNILELKLNFNNLQDVIIPIQSLIDLQISNNKLVNVDFSGLINLQILDISCNKIEYIKLDKLVKLKQLNLSNNILKQLILSNKQCQKLNLSSNRMISLKIWQLEKLNQLNLDYNQFQILELDNPFLEILDISYNNLKQQNFSALINLKQLTIISNKLLNLTLTNPKLQYINISNNLLTSVDFQALVNLKYLNLSYNQLKQLYLDNPLLETLNVDNNKLQNLDLKKLINLKELNAENNKLSQFPQINMKSLQQLYLRDNKLKKINLNGYTNLREVDISNNRIYNINIDKLSNLKSLDISNNCITSINIKKKNNPKLQKIRLNNSFSYQKYFLEQQLTEQQVARYKQQKQKTEANDSQLLTKLGFYPNITKETYSKIVQTINYQYDKKIKIEDNGNNNDDYNNYMSKNNGNNDNQW